jgi:hypothetical protein
LDRLPTDVHACDTIRIRLEAALSAMEVSPVPPIAPGNVSTSGACLACVLGWNLKQRYSDLAGFVGERVTEEAVGYPVGLSSALTSHLPFPSPESVEALDGDCCVLCSSETGQLFGEEPSARADVVALSSAEAPQLQSRFASVSFLVSVFLQYGSAVLVSDLPQRDIASKVELLQNPASPLVHHGDSNAIGVLVDADHILCDSWRWRILLEQHQETVATGHQDACGSPTITYMFQESVVGSITQDRQTEAFMVSPYTQNGVSTRCTPPREEAFVESYRWPLNPICDLASLPSIPLRFLNQLARYLHASVVLIDRMVQGRVRLRFRGPYRLKRRGRGFLEGEVGFMELSLFSIGQRCKVELQ